MTVPPCLVDRLAPPSQPAASTHTTVMSAGPPAASTLFPRVTGSRASAITISSTSPSCSRSRAASVCVGTTPMTVAAPARRAATADSEPLLPAAPMMTATDPGVTTRWVRAGAPHTSMTAKDKGTGRSSGRTAAMERAKRMAWPSQGICSDWPSQRYRESVMTSGVRVSETRVAMRWPGFKPRGESGPTSSTVPVSMPPEPVTGFCILPRVAMMSPTAARILSGSAA